MAQYIFETMAQSDASNFTSTDFLYFFSAGVANIGISDAPSTTTTNGLGTTITAETITLTEGTKSLVFGASALSLASKTSPSHLVIGSDVLVLGTDAAADVGSSGTLSLAQGSAGHAAVALGFGGADSLVGGAANDTLNGGEGADTIVGSSSTTDSGGHFTESDYLLGGNGADSIVGGAGNDHIYGNLFTSTAGAADGNDVVDGGVGNDYLQGNKGADSLVGNDGNDSIHGGADNDSLLGGNGADSLWGDAGNDTVSGGEGDDWISGGVGYDSLTGGNGVDTFSFATGDDSVANLDTATTATNHGVVDVVTDFTHATDKLALGFTPAHVDFATGGTTFTTVDDAYTYAKGLLSGHGTDVASLQVGANTYVFYDSTHSTGTIDSVVELGTFTASTLATGDFA